jgi:hypothetical protein
VFIEVGDQSGHNFFTIYDLPFTQRPKALNDRLLKRGEPDATGFLFEHKTLDIRPNRDAFGICLGFQPSFDFRRKFNGHALLDYQFL